MTLSNEGRNKIAVIAGAGPAGLTAALELLRRSDITPIVFEADGQVGGISKTINYRGNRMDLGGHRFFSKSDWVMRWWQEILPVAEGQANQSGALRIHYQGQSRELTPEAFGSASSDAVMLVRQRLSRIFYRRRFFDYPLTLNAGHDQESGTHRGITNWVELRPGAAHSRGPLRITLEDFFINRFGTRLYRTFFKDYTEKVWGVPCEEISAEWGAQRIKGLSVAKAIAHALAKPLSRLGGRRSERDRNQSDRAIPLPQIRARSDVGGSRPSRSGPLAEQIHLRSSSGRHGARRPDELPPSTCSMQPRNSVRRVPCDHFVSTMPVRDLIAMSETRRCASPRIAADFPTETS